MKGIDNIYVHEAKNDIRQMIQEVLSIIESIKQNHPTVEPQDIAIVFFDGNKDNYALADMLAAPSAPGEYKLHIKSKDKQSEKIITIIVESAKDYPTIQFNDNTNRFVYTGEPIMPSITVRYKGKIIDSELYNIYCSDRYYNKSNIYGYNNNNFMPIDADLYNIHVQFDPELTSFTESISAEFQIREAHYIETCPRILLSDTFYICDNKIKVPQIEKVSILVGSSLEIEILQLGIIFMGILLIFSIL
jgi:hypothetical protein